MVEVEIGVLEGLVEDEVELKVVKELLLEVVVVPEDEDTGMGAELDGDAEFVKVIVVLWLGAIELDCGSGFDVDIVDELTPGPPPAIEAGGVPDVPAFGHNVETPFPMKNIPINVLG